MYAIEMIGVTKVFGTFKANDNITVRVKKQEIHALLGENGAGKSTLMNMLFGFYELDGGEIKITGEKVDIKNPNIANALGIGMVHQHFKLVNTFTVTQNIILGSEPKKGLVVDIKSANKKVQDIIDQYNFNIKATDKIYDLTVGQQQKVEILKMLYRDAEYLIFDEPTGALTPQETKELLNIIEKLRADGKTIILITHKLKEIKAICDNCTVIRRGVSIETFDVKSTSEEKMAELMVGRKVSFEVNKEDVQAGDTLLKINELNMYNRFGSKTVDNLSMEVKKGEILGIAGVDGNGQIELIDGIMGLQKVESGQVFLNGVDISNYTVRKRNEKKIGFIPQDRQKFGVVLDYTITENSVLKEYFKVPYSKNGLLNYNAMKTKAKSLVQKYDIRSNKGITSTVRDMSGGNQQKLIIAREIESNPDLLIAVQPTRGVDVGAIENIHEKILRERSKGKAIILVSLELEEVMKLSDRIAVMHNGKLMGIVDAKGATEEKIGLMMAGMRG
ncbi:MAG: ABC transporter ATP-binding protein [Mycoplasmatales bacterium]